MGEPTGAGQGGEEAAGGAGGGERGAAEEGGSVTIPSSEIRLREEGADSGIGREEGGPEEAACGRA